MNDCQMISICREFFDKTKTNQANKWIEIAKRYKKLDHNFYLLLRFIDVCFFQEDFKQSFLDWNKEIIQPYCDNILEQMLFDLFRGDYQGFIQHSSCYFIDNEEAIIYISNYLSALQLQDLQQIIINGQLLEFIRIKEQYSEVKLIIDIILGCYDKDLPYLDWKSEISIILQFGNQSLTKGDLQQLVKDRLCSSFADEIMKNIFFLKEMVPNYIISMLFNISPSAAYVIQEIFTYSNLYKQGQLVQIQENKQYLIKHILINKDIKIQATQFQQLYVDCLIESIEHDTQKKYIILHSDWFNCLIEIINHWPLTDVLTKKIFTINYFDRGFAKQTLLSLINKIEEYSHPYDMFQSLYELSLIADGINELKANIIHRLNHKLSEQEELFLKGMLDYLVSNKQQFSQLLYPYQFVISMKLDYKLNLFDIEIPVNLSNNQMNEFAYHFIRNTNEYKGNEIQKVEIKYVLNTFVYIKILEWNLKFG
ncbi:hypothetical protein pb186bvf_009455 [Paramecium bursaria]